MAVSGNNALKRKLLDRKGVLGCFLLTGSSDNAEVLAASHGRFLPQSGAVLIKNAEGQVLGAAGASGGSGDEDESICMAGIDAAGLSHA
jgi:uncharacterized protein GlcG (DUF336 family)